MIFVRLSVVCLCLNLLSANPFLHFDLTHTLNSKIPYFPSQVRFNFTQQIVNTDNSYFYSTNAFVTSEHMGTHLDAPYHFYPTGWKVDEIPLKYLTSINARIIDVSKQCQANRNYLITIDDVKQVDLTYPRIDENTGEQFLFVLIFYTGWTKYWPEQSAYAGEDSNIEFPGLSEPLANYLIEQYRDNLVGVGIDTLSTDYGQSKTYPVHQILAKNNKYGLENLALTKPLLDSSDSNFFQINVFPIKIGNGTGAPCRVIARIDNRSNINTNWFGLLVFFFIIFLILFAFKVIYDLRYNPNKDF